MPCCLSHSNYEDISVLVFNDKGKEWSMVLMVFIMGKNAGSLTDSHTHTHIYTQDYQSIQDLYNGVS